MDTAPDFDIMDSSSESSLEIPLSPAKRIRLPVADPSDQYNHDGPLPTAVAATATRATATATAAPTSGKSVPTHYLQTKANHVNLQLTAYGYPVPLVFDTKDNSDALSVINCIQLMLQDIKRYQDEQVEYQETIASLQQEQEDTQQRLDRCLSDLSNKEDDLAQTKNRMQALKEQLKQQDETNRHVKDELARAKHNMQYMKTQYAHETRRHNLELTKTRERLTKLMKDKLKVNVVSMNIQHESPLAELDLEPKSTPEQDALALQRDKLVKALEREDKARKDNKQLRHSMIKVYSSMRRLLETRWQEFEDRYGTNESKLQMLQAIEKFQLSTDGSDMVAQIDTLLVRLEEEWQRQTIDTVLYTEKDMQDKDQLIAQWQEQVNGLEQAMDQLKSDFDEREQVYLRFSHGGFFDTLHPAPLDLSDDDEWGDEEVEYDEKNRYQRMQYQAKKDQAKITEAALALGDERAKLEAERRAFDELKRQTTLLEIMDSPPTPQSKAKRRRM